MPINGSRILISDSIPSSACDMLKSRGFEVDYKPGISKTELLAIIDSYEGLIIRSSTNVDAEVIEQGVNLRVIGRGGVGVDNVNISEATRKGIVVMNVPGGNTVSACEHTWALILSLVRNIPTAHQALREGRWEKKKSKGTELFGKTLGLYGLGKIGSEVARRALAFDMKIIAFDPFASEKQATDLRVRLVDFDGLLSNSDILSIHAPLNEKTKNAINNETLIKMKRTGFLVNCARGGIVNQEDLAEALENKIISGAAVDVYPVEPVTDSPLFKLENIVHTPHLGASTLEAEERVSLEISSQVATYLAGGNIVNAVNAVSDDIDMKLVVLARGVSQICASLTDSLTKKLTISYKEKLRCSGEMLVRIVLTEYLSSFFEGINTVNCRLIAEERDIEVISQAVSSVKEKWDIKITSEDKFIAEGSSAGGVSRLTGLNGYVFDIPLSGNLLMIENTDRPGMIGRIGSLLGENSINIASMEVGRKKLGGLALTLIQTDEPVTEELIRELSDLDNIELIKSIKVGQ